MKWSKEGYTGGFGGRKGKKKWKICHYIIISKLKESIKINVNKIFLIEWFVIEI